jgi:hypothetical protein
VTRSIINVSSMRLRYHTGLRDNYRLAIFFCNLVLGRRLVTVTKSLATLLYLWGRFQIKIKEKHYFLGPED